MACLLADKCTSEVHMEKWAADRCVEKRLTMPCLVGRKRRCTAWMCGWDWPEDHWVLAACGWSSCEPSAASGIALAELGSTRSTLGSMAKQSNYVTPLMHSQTMLHILVVSRECWLCQAKPSQSSNWGRRLAHNRHLNSNRVYAYTNDFEVRLRALTDLAKH